MSVSTKIVLVGALVFACFFHPYQANASSCSSPTPTPQAQKIGLDVPPNYYVSQVKVPSVGDAGLACSESSTWISAAAVAIVVALVIVGFSIKVVKEA